jgi:tetrahydrodipicolinate N-succinyltransferase
LNHGEKINTGLQFLGAIIGDHCKIGINSSLNSGVVIGFGCNIYGGTMVRDYIPNFRWGLAGNLITYQQDKFLETAEKVKLRRDIALSDIEKELYIKLEHPEVDKSKI